MLSCKLAVFWNLAVCCHAHPQGILNHPAVKHWKDPWHAKTHRTGLGIWGRPEFVYTGTEYLATGLELDMHLKTYNSFIVHKRLNSLQPELSVSKV